MKQQPQQYPDLRWWSEDPNRAAEQKRHNERHPGLVCQTCPVELESRARLRATTDRLAQPDWRLTTRGRWAAVVLFFVTSGVLGWYAYDVSTWVLPR